VNTGDEPLVYLGVYPAAAGHDYAAVAERNFRYVVVARDNGPELLDRETYTASLAQR
jgi:glucose-6-phosphate isomerase